MTVAVTLIGLVIAAFVLVDAHLPARKEAVVRHLSAMYRVPEPTGLGQHAVQRLFRVEFGRQCEVVKDGDVWRATVLLTARCNIRDLEARTCRVEATAPTWRGCYGNLRHALQQIRTTS